MQESGADKKEKYTPWIVGTFAVVMIALGAYLSFGGSFHFKQDVDVSASSRSTSSQ